MVSENWDIENAIDLIRYINLEANNIYGENGNFDHKEYIRKCNSALSNYLKNSLDNRYLFSTLSAWDRRKKDGVVFANPKKRYHYKNEQIQRIFWPIIEGEDKLLDKIQSKEVNSITHFLLQEVYGRDLVFFGSNNYNPPITSLIDNNNSKIDFFSLSELKLLENIEEFVKYNSSKIEYFIQEIIKIRGKYDTKENTGKLLWHYKKMQEEYLKKYRGTDFLVHFIRPGFVDFDHNMLLSLATNELVTPDEIAIINLLVFKIVGLMASQQKEEQQEKERINNLIQISYSLGHNLKNRMLGCESSLADILKDLRCLTSNPLGQIAV